ncbi:MAG: DNA replication and repair protein RecF [Candidatus Zixiibacteriota bacterium]
MQVEQLHITGFRNLPQVTLSPHSGPNIVFGPNGAGKTNLLEALFVLLLGRSQRGSPDAMLVRQGEDIYRVAGQVHDGDTVRQVAVAYRRGERKKITIDRVTTRVSELYEHFSVVSLGPEDIEIVAGSPSARRNFLDTYLSQFSASYLHHLIGYHRALKQKNAALRLEQDAAVFESLLIDHGSHIMQARGQFTDSLREVSDKSYAELASGSKLELAYEPSTKSPVSELGGIRHDLATAMHRRRDEERRQQRALVGPHRDELAIQIRSLPARTHASRGEWRTAAIALKLGVYNMLNRQRRHSPVLLLDEVFAELDRQRAESLIAAFGDFGQLFVTTAGDPPAALQNEGRRFHVDNGVVREVS